MNLIYKEDALACCTDYGFTKAKEVMDAINDLPVVDVSLLNDTETYITDLAEARKVTLHLVEAADDERDNALEQDHWHEEILREASNLITSLLARIFAQEVQIKELEAERDSAIRGRDSWRDDYKALSAAIVGDTGLSAVTVATQARLFRLRAEAAETAHAASEARVVKLVEALNRISLGSQNSMTSKEALGKEARAAITEANQ